MEAASFLSDATDIDVSLGPAPIGSIMRLIDLFRLCFLSFFGLATDASVALDDIVAFEVTKTCVASWHAETFFIRIHKQSEPRLLGGAV